jgi:hypothetical protein
LFAVGRRPSAFQRHTSLVVDPHGDLQVVLVLFSTPVGCGSRLIMISLSSRSQCFLKHAVRPSYRSPGRLMDW